ncbi:MAG: asparagine synthase (glutamine-hydrolyzing) [Anaerolineales bacterium]|nr:asparagine synthase (glutamine-hydrolyzing) [Anaerolineales bacterium]
MCGILGLLAPGAHPHLAELLPLLAHRGPDDAGCHADADVFLGARRLSVIDVAGGHQPLSVEGGQVWVVQNGEIYNHPALRGELEALGHVFRTRSDTEVIAHAYAAWGDDCVRRLRGIYAFAVWDAARRRLLLARDRFGVKPLYYAELPGGGLAFASEIRPLLALRRQGARANTAALRALFALGFVPSPLTAFEGIAKLPAAHTLAARAGQVRLARYWDLPGPVRNGSRRESAAEAVEGFGAHLARAVSEQRMSEAPLGALISGGLDSASIAALLAAELRAEAGEPVHTFNIGFEQPGYDEARFAALTARRLGVRHHQVRFGAADFDRYPEIVARLEEPQCSATALPIYRLYQACRAAGLVVILTGEGADELLGGYHWFQGDARARRLFVWPAPLRRLAAASPLPISAAGRRVLRSGEASALARYALWQRPGEAETSTVFVPDLRRQAGGLDVWLAGLDGAGGWRDPFRQFQYFEARTRLVDFINFEVDRMSMAHSIEARVPFLDHELWEYAARLPSSLLTSGRPKFLLRAAMRGRLPAEVLARRKQGLAAPHAAWLRRTRLPEWAEVALSPAALVGTGYFEAAEVGRLRREHQARRANHARVLMGVLSTQLWHGLFVAGGP